MTDRSVNIKSFFIGHCFFEPPFDRLRASRENTEQHRERLWVFTTEAPFGRLRADGGHGERLWVLLETRN